MEGFNPPKRNLNWTLSEVPEINSDTFQSTKEEFKREEVVGSVSEVQCFNPPKRNLNSGWVVVLDGEGLVSIHQRGI